MNSTLRLCGTILGFCRFSPVSFSVSVPLWQIRSSSPQSPIRSDGEQPPLRDPLREGRLIERQVHAVNLLIVSPKFARVFF